MSYGCSFIVPNIFQQKQYLPQVGLDVHVTILSFNSQTVFGGSSAKPGPQSSPSPFLPMGSMMGAASSRPECTAGASKEADQAFGSTIASQQTSESDFEQHWTRVLIPLQRFHGFWDLDENFIRALTLDADSTRAELDTQLKRLYGESPTLWDHPEIVKILATCLAGIFLENKASDSKDVWELVKHKADRWVERTLESLGQTDQDNARKMKGDLISLC